MQRHWYLPSWIQGDPMLTVQHFSDLASLSEQVAAEIAARLQEAISQRGQAHLVLTGGRTPRLTYENLSRLGIDWSRVHIYWSDERWLPHSHAESNFALARKTLLQHVAPPGANIHPMPCNGADIAADAALYDGLLRNYLVVAGKGERQGGSGAGHLFDITLLGMGEDGHVASLFPGHPLLSEKILLAAAVDERIGTPAVPRITMTFAALSRSRCVLLLISGEAKKKILEQILTGEDRHRFPAAMVTAKEEIRWYAAS
jgi:6-phosphogluconolactonase